MKQVTVYQYNAFSRLPDKGNPAGVVLDADDLTDIQMLEIARRVGFNETSFIVKSEVADLRIRYFTPGHEMNLCGHATVASLYALTTRGLLSLEDLKLETKAGLLPMQIRLSESGFPIITMQQSPAQFVVFDGKLDELAASIGLTLEDLDLQKPTVYGSTGIWTLLVPIKELGAFQRMVPNNIQFPEVLRGMPRASIHPFCMETYDPAADMHARHFSSPYSGTIEDPVTGTASGVMGAYYATYIRNGIDEPIQLVVEQGHEMEREGQVEVTVTPADNNYEVTISGSGVYVKEFQIEITSV
ncbi:PhzF family phenazine biosynthesis protein [Paenibacillus agricola]|uniref:PhzF family phenazine biosynthesis protein n=1 Tax=Paenibacillus agricola TaxID=2716264 RepID=A0ABX0J2K1_9BACL|nr:PhzF family phenazine biosynthesis protein [Paenibacillus agricola]NHN30577.1 PhzF family phenazine biosynthesis protein [Paenibacillus agricola]